MLVNRDPSSLAQFHEAMGFNATGVQHMNSAPRQDGNSLALSNLSTGLLTLTRLSQTMTTREEPTYVEQHPLHCSAIAMPLWSRANHNDEENGTNGFYVYNRALVVAHAPPPNSANVGLSERSVAISASVMLFNKALAYHQLGGGSNTNKALQLYNLVLNTTDRVMGATASRDSELLQILQVLALNNLTHILILQRQLESAKDCLTQLQPMLQRMKNQGMVGSSLFFVTLFWGNALQELELNFLVPVSRFFAEAA